MAARWTPYPSVTRPLFPLRWSVFVLNRFPKCLVPACGLLALGLAGCTSGAAAAGPGGGGRGRGGEGGAVRVVTTKVGERDVPVDRAAIGNVEAYTGISVRSQITGQLREASFHEGDMVKKGELLFTIDQRPFEAALQQAQANLVRDQALLSQAEAQLARDAAQAEYQQLAPQRQAPLPPPRLVSND